MAPPPPGPYSGVSQLALVARASAFAFGVVYGNMKLKYLKLPRDEFLVGFLMLCDYFSNISDSNRSDKYHWMSKWRGRKYPQLQGKMGKRGGGGAIGRIAKLREVLARWRGRSSSAPPDVPPGHVAVIVGCERRRFVVRATHLSHPAFQTLLAEAEEEYGFGYRDGPLSIPCDESVFSETLRRVNSTRSGSLTPTRFAPHGKCDPDSRPGESSQLLLLDYGVS
ncbi:hypothetical protein V2J09_002206 [Rumex salicifolius]